MKSLLTFLFLSLFVASNAQLTVSPDIIDFSTDSRDSLYEYKMKIKNESNDSTSFFWMVELADDWPADWDIFVCDNNLCYFTGVYKCPNNKINVFPPQHELEFKITLLTGFTKGKSSMKLHLFTDMDCQGQFYSSSDWGSVEVTGGTSVNDLTHLKNTKIYPNPVINTFNISNDEFVTKVEMRNIQGQVVQSFDHLTHESHDISPLSQGVYIVELRDKQGNVKREKMYKD